MSHDLRSLMLLASKRSAFAPRETLGAASNKHLMRRCSLCSFARPDEPRQNESFGLAFGRAFPEVSFSKSLLRSRNYYSA